MKEERRTMKRLLTAAIALLIALGVLSGTVAAQSDEVISATVDRTALTTDDLLTLTVTIDRASGASDPVLPELDGFSLLGTSSGTQISIINGDMSVQLAYTYYLQPTQVGDLVIGPFTTTANGQTYQTEPILISVAQGTGQFQPALPGMPSFGSLIPSLPGMPSTQVNPANPPSGGTLPAPEGLNGQDYYVEALVDNANPYQGEQVLYLFRFYQGASLLVEPNYEAPDFTGFWHDRQPEQTTYTTEAAGRTYYVTEIQTVLFPTVTGEVTIEPSVLEIPGGFFSEGQSLATQPVAVTIKPLPPNPPAGFSGAVGQFGLQSLVDKTTSEVNDAVMLQVTLSGVGNIETLADLTWDVGPEWRAFDPEVESTSSFANGRLQGSRIYEQLLVPTVAGSLTIPPIPFSYFDPLVGEYQTIETQPIVVQVAPASGALPSVGQGAVVPAGLEVPGLRPMKAAPERWRSTPGALVEKPGYWALFAVPVVMLAGLAGFGAVTAYRSATAGDRRRQQAANRAVAELQQARKHPEQAASAAAHTLHTYLSTKLDQPTIGLTQQALGDLLRRQGISPELAAGVQNCLRDSETAVYFPGFSDDGVTALLDEVEAIVRQLDAAFAEGNRDADLPAS